MQFWKYHGAGNDFIMVDQRQHRWLERSDRARIAQLCDRHFGIGADGLIILEKNTQPNEDFDMVYFNADGGESTLCGNGGRCIVAFAKHQGVVSGNCRFRAIDGPHEARFGPASAEGNEWVELEMSIAPEVQHQGNRYFLQTGSPHVVDFVNDVQAVDIIPTGRAVRYHADYATIGGTNVNFATWQQGILHLRTYERGVEGETLACGTGATAAALAAVLHHQLPRTAGEIPIQAQGGRLSVRYQYTEGIGFHNVWLCGPAQRVFQGTV